MIEIYFFACFCRLQQGFCVYLVKVDAFRYFVEPAVANHQPEAAGRFYRRHQRVACLQPGFPVLPYGSLRAFVYLVDVYVREARDRRVRNAAVYRQLEVANRRRHSFAPCQREEENLHVAVYKQRIRQSPLLRHIYHARGKHIGHSLVVMQRNPV